MYPTARPAWIRSRECLRQIVAAVLCGSLAACTGAAPASDGAVDARALDGATRDAVAISDGARTDEATDATADDATLVDVVADDTIADDVAPDVVNLPDTGMPDAGMPDAGVPDAAPVDAGFAAEPLMIGLSDSNANMFTNPGFDAFFTSTSGARHRHLAHVYVHWDIALEPAGSADRVTLQAWLDRAAAHGVEPLVSFTPEPGAALPSAHAFGAAFAAFQRTWPVVRAFNAWNEPNGAFAGSARTAADIFLEAYSRCQPSAGCIVTAGDMLGRLDGDVSDFTMMTGPDAPCGSASCSWLDRYKYSIVQDAAAYGAPGLRPRYWAVHDWGDAHNYQEHSAHCSSASNCVIRALLASLQGSWASTEVWVTENGAEAAGSHANSSLLTQACAGRFLQRLYGVDRRITRFYYYNFEGGSNDNGVCPYGPNDTGPCFSAGGQSTRPVYDVLRDRVAADMAGCP